MSGSQSSSEVQSSLGADSSKMESTHNGSTSEPVASDVSRSRSDVPDGSSRSSIESEVDSKLKCDFSMTESGQVGPTGESALSTPRTRKVSVLDVMPSGDSESVPDGIKVRRAVDVGLGMGSPSQLSPTQRSPMFWCQPHSLRSGSSSHSVPMFPFSKKDATSSSDPYSRDLVEHPYKLESLRNVHSGPAEVRSDETDANPLKPGVHDVVEKEPESPGKQLLEAPMPVEPDAEEYPMAHKSRVAVIFNHDSFRSEEERRGSDKDIIALDRSLKFLGFDVDVHHNFTRQQIADELDRLVNVGFENCDCFCMVVMTHGEALELLHAKDGVYQQRELWMPFIPDVCPSLAGKPKLFFIQACRGEGTNKGVRLVKYSNTSQTDTIARWSYVIPSSADFLIAHSTTEGFYAWRDPKEGSWWIQKLCQELSTRGRTADLLKILTVVNRRVAIEEESYVLNRPDLTGCKEMPSFTSTLLRDLYFRPKILQSTTQPSAT